MRGAPGLPPSLVVGLPSHPFLGLLRDLLFGERLLYSSYQPLSVERQRVDRGRIAANQRGKGGRQLVRAWHLHLVHQDRDHPNLPGERRFNFQPHLVPGIIEATLTFLIGDR